MPYIPKTPLVKLARDFAIKAHGDQLYGDEPYVVHLDEVAAILDEFGYDETVWQNAYISAYLHDVFEDTDASQMEVRRLFGVPVWRSVLLLTDPEAPNRKQRKELMLQAIQALPMDAVLGECYPVFVVKPADRLANMRRGGKLDMYAQEHAVFASVFNAKGKRSARTKQMFDEMDTILGAC